MSAQIRFQVNICGGDFQHVRECFRAWKTEPLLGRSDRWMFDGQNEVRILSGHAFHSAEQASNALKEACKLYDLHALAAEVCDDDGNLWIIMAAYDE